jgi:dimeric dUTPase (all-alpha-NTP-PPase superfamily)
MSTPEPEDSRQVFEHFSNEYAQALQAFAAIENQASTLQLMGYTDELRQFVEQFLLMARRTRDLAIERGETNFAEWFSELVQKAEKLKTTVAK